MNRYRLILICLLVITSLVLITSCTSENHPKNNINLLESSQRGYEGKKILFINSYHKGYEWSDRIEEGVHSILDGTGVELKFLRLDTKRNVDEEFRKNAAIRAKNFIDEFKPDIIIAADDNAQAYLIVPYIKDTGIPVIFSGVNWDATLYGYPTETITGMIEVELPERLIGHLKKYSNGTRIGFISGNTTTMRKVVNIYNKRFFKNNLKPYFVDSMDEFEASFLRAQEEVDILIFYNYAGIQGWNDEVAKKFIINNIKIPTGSLIDYMAPFVLLTLGKVPEEQGEYSAEIALKILNGVKPSELPIVTNKKGKLIVNLEIADKLNVIFEPNILKNSEVIK